MSVNFDKTGIELPAYVPIGVSGPRVDLMPPEIGAEQSFRKTQLVLGACALGVVGLLAGGWVLSIVQAGNAADELAAEQAVTQQLAAEEAKYAEVPAVLTRIDSVRQAQTQAMVSDVAWYSQLDQINREYPQGLVFQTLEMTLNDPNEAGTETVGPLVSGDAIGTIKMEGVGVDYVNGSQWLEAMAAHPGFIDQYYSSFELTQDEAGDPLLVKQTTTVGFTDDLLTHRFDQKAGE